MSSKFTIYNEDDFENMSKAGFVAASALDMLAEHVSVGVTTAYLDRLAFEFLGDHKALPATLGYRGYRHSSCISINHVICHGIPGGKILKDGDILNIDITAIVNGFHGDTSRMYYAGKPKVRASRLVDTTFKAMWAGINIVKPGTTLYEIGKAIQTVAEQHKYSVVFEFCGHGVGRNFHEAPNILHYGEIIDRSGEIHRTEHIEIKKGMCFTIEPMLNEGKGKSKLLNDGWTAVTRDKSLSAQFEHSLGVTENGFKVFTMSPKGFDNPPYKT